MNDETTPGKRPTRRDFLYLAGGALVGAGITAASAAAITANRSGTATTAESEDSPEDDSPEILRFMSTALTVPAITTWTRDGGTPAAGYLFATPRTDINTGAIYDTDGQPIWIDPSGVTVTNLQVQQYLGSPVLTCWQGTVLSGYGTGVGRILDTSYTTIATVRAGNGLQADLHEFKITDRGTALTLAYPMERADLSTLDGPDDGWILGARMQEIDIATGEVLLDWNAFDHIDLSESYQGLSDGADGSSAENRYDPIHLNSVDDDGEVLILSGRHTQALYGIDRSTGELLWRLGGRRSDYTLDEDATFLWQHDGRRQPDGRISVFDNHGKSGGDAISAGLLLDVDEQAKHVSLATRFSDEEHVGYAQGNTQLLSTGGAMVGWGSNRDATEFDADGEPVFEARGLGSASYRSFKFEWSATPASVPDIAAVQGSDDLVVYASWNGATDVAQWRVFTGADASSLTEAAVVDRTGFETSATVPQAAWVQVEALRSDGTPLARSRALAS